MRLHWDDPDGTHLYEDFPCVHDALERAASVYEDNEGTLTRLENWLGEDACPADQILPCAIMRSEIRAETRERDKDEDDLAARAIF
jgi:hypothetical protein